MVLPGLKTDRRSVLKGRRDWSCSAPLSLARYSRGEVSNDISSKSLEGEEGRVQDELNPTFDL